MVFFFLLSSFYDNVNSGIRSKFSFRYCLQVVVGVRNIVRQRALLFERLEIVEAIWTFISHHMSSAEKLRAKLERAESDFAAA